MKIFDSLSRFEDKFNENGSFTKKVVLGASIGCLALGGALLGVGEMAGIKALEDAGLLELAWGVGEGAMGVAIIKFAPPLEPIDRQQPPVES